jgi:hypothetical protein
LEEIFSPPSACHPNDFYTLQEEISDDRLLSPLPRVQS